MIAAFFERTIGVLSKAAGRAVGEKIRSFRTGLDTLRTMGDLASVLGVSLGMWALITTAYLLTATAFTASPHLAQMTVTKGMVLMIVSGGASIFQLPVLGWFIQIGVVATALACPKFFDVPPGSCHSVCRHAADRYISQRCSGRDYLGSVRTCEPQKGRQR